LIPSVTTSAMSKTEPTRSGTRRTKNVGAIIGGTLGGVVFLGLVATLVIWFLRRRQKPIDDKRWSFHRHMMVRPPVLNISHTSPTGVNVSAEDVERGLPHEAIIRSASNVMTTTSPSEPRLELPSQPVPDLPLEGRWNK
jgi:hypothetical protein